MIEREMTERDRRYVVPTWAEGAKGYRGLRKHARYALVDRILDDGARVICLATGNVVHAWACGRTDGGALHYVYVPPELRGHGLARRVIEAALGSYDDHINVTHPWPGASPRFRYTPHLLQRFAA